MSTDEYVPSEEDAVDNYVAGRGVDDPGLSLAELRAEYGPEFDRFLARVRRDALDGLIDHARRLAREGTLGPGTAKVQSGAAIIAEEYRDTHYPEETP